MYGVIICEAEGLTPYLVPFCSKKESYEKSKVIAGLSRFAKRCTEFCRRKGGKCEDVNEILEDDDKKDDMKK